MSKVSLGLPTLTFIMCTGAVFLSFDLLGGIKELNKCHWGGGLLLTLTSNHKNDLMMCWDLHQLKHLDYENPAPLLCISVDVRMGTVY